MRDSSAGSVECTLSELRRLLRMDRAEDGETTVMSGRVPEDLQREGFVMLALFSDEAQALARLRDALTRDLRFEHLGERELKDETWRLVVLAHDGLDPAPAFIASHAREPEEHTCFFDVELLTVTQDVELHGVKLLPQPWSPDGSDHAEASTEPPSGSVIAVPCCGTSRARMRDRARPKAEHVLRVLRAAFREEHFMPAEQLRFRLGRYYWFEDTPAGWTRPAHEGWELEADVRMIDRARSVPVFALSMEATNEIEERTLVALRWFEQSQFATDPIMELLFLFTALEAILGEKSEGLKGNALALRRAMLGLNTAAGFVHPSRAFLLYDQVRSAAVHGERPPEISQAEVDSLAWDTRRAINEYLEFAQRHGFVRRRQVRRKLRADPRRDNILERLVEQHPKLWEGFLRRERES